MSDKLSGGRSHVQYSHEYDFPSILLEAVPCSTNLPWDAECVCVCVRAGMRARKIQAANQHYCAYTHEYD